MKRVLIILITLISFNSNIYSLEKSGINNNFGIGFQIGQIQDDFGFGLNITSPSFLQDKIAFRLRGNMSWFEHIDGIETAWTPYTNLSIGIIGVGGNLNEFIRLYGEGGVILLFPNDKFSSESMKNGGYGLFGFEFFHTPNFNYFIEIGGVGTGANANKIPFNPIYSNGLLINAGLRVTF